MSNVAVDVSSVDWKKHRVLEILDGALVPGKVAKLKSFLSKDCHIVFPAFEARGHGGVDQLMKVIDSMFDGCPTKSYDLWICNRLAANVHGSLFGRMKDGRSMDGTRYTDTFVFDEDGLVVKWLVFNDLPLLPPL